MARDIQPDNFFLKFTNTNVLPGNNDLEYYYREGEIWATGTLNLFEPKTLNLNQSTTSRTTRIKSVLDPIMNGGVFITPAGESITLKSGRIVGGMTLRHIEHIEYIQYYLILKLLIY